MDKEGSSLTSADRKLLLCCACQHLLDDPRQLQCLHNCCRRCVDDIATKEGGHRVTCPECRQATNIEAARRNHFIAACVSRVTTPKEAEMCGVCKEEGVASQPALVWCTSCRRSLCAACTAGHAKYNRTHVTVQLEEVNWDDECRAPPIVCLQHEKPVTCVCFTCDATQCIECWKLCNANRHEMQPIDYASVHDYVTKQRNDVRSRRNDLQSKQTQVSANIGLLREVEQARDAALAGLKQRKEQVLVAIDHAYVAAVESIKESFDLVLAKANELSNAAASLDCKISYIVSYSDTLVKFGDTCSVIHQRKHLLGQFSALADEVDAVRPATHVANMVTVEASLPENLQEAVTAWIGLPRLTSHYLRGLKRALLEKNTAQCDKADGIKRNELVGDKARKDTSDSDGPLSTAIKSSPRSSAMGTTGIVSLGQTTKVVAKGVQSEQWRFNTIPSCNGQKVSTDCWDIAVMPDGHLLLAALQHGLKEFDVCTGQETTIWKPAEEQQAHIGQHWITRVDCLSDGRAVIALSYKYPKNSVLESAVIVLRQTRREGGGGDGSGDRGCPRWFEERLFVGLSPPQQLAASGDFLATAESEQDGWSWHPGRRITLIELRSGKTLWQETLSYRVQSLALAGRLVVTASSEKLALRGGLARYMVEGRSITGVHLWRQALTEQVIDMCPAPPRTRSSERSEVCLSQRDGLWTIVVETAEGNDETRDAVRVRVARSVERDESKPFARLSAGRGFPATFATLTEGWRTATAYIVDTTQSR